MVAKVDTKPSKGTVTSFELDHEALAAREAEVAKETDQEILDRLAGRFQILENMTNAIAAGDMRAMIVQGPPGVGKSHGVNKVLERVDLMERLKATYEPRFEIVKGTVSSLGLYAKLYKYADEKKVLVFDDCDGVLMDELSLNILKGALDSSDKRTICWNTDSRMLKAEGIPNTFDFKGAVIFITNVKFEYVRSKKLRSHLEALESRCHYIDLQMDTNREKILRIKQIVGEGMIDEKCPDPAVRASIIQYVEDNQNKLRELSLRMVLKIADLHKSFPRAWPTIAKTTCMKRGA